MRQMTIEDFDNLKHGDTVVTLVSGKERRLRYVGRMPNSENYFIFSDGEHLEHFHKSFSRNNYHIGEYDNKYMHNLHIKYHEKTYSKYKR